MELPGKTKRGRHKRRYTDVAKEDMAVVEVMEEDAEDRTEWRWEFCCGKEKPKHEFNFTNQVIPTGHRSEGNFEGAGLGLECGAGSVHRLRTTPRVFRGVCLGATVPTLHHRLTDGRVVSGKVDQLVEDVPLADDRVDQVRITYGLGSG